MGTLCPSDGCRDHPGRAVLWIQHVRPSLLDPCVAAIPGGGAIALTCFALAGILGNLLGGFAADRFGHVRIATGGFVALLPLIPAFLAVTSEPAALAGIVLIGFALSTTYSPLIILGQRYLPNRIGFSAGVTLG